VRPRCGVHGIDCSGVAHEVGKDILLKQTVDALEGAAIHFVRDAFGHLKAIGADQGGHVLLRSANVTRDAGVVDASDDDAFIAAAKTRQWDREKAVRTLA
jgi:hypothetical protein